MVLAGPMANAALFAGSLFWLSHQPFDPDPASRQVIQSPIPFQMLLANGYLLLFGLFPYRARIGGVLVPNDGLRALLLLLGREPFPRQPPAGTGPTDVESGTTDDPNLAWQLLVTQVPAHILLAAHRKLLAQSSLSASERNHALDSFATGVLMYGATEYLPEADRYSEELIRSQPNEWTVKGTRGSILVEKGDVQAGMDMLLQVLESDPSEFDQAIAASFLALAEWKRHNQEAAQTWLRRATEIQPNCVAAKRIEGIVHNQPAGR
jgi:hypothetical protein